MPYHPSTWRLIGPCGGKGERKRRRRRKALPSGTTALLSTARTKFAQSKAEEGLAGKKCLEQQYGGGERRE